jgi:hypothetical protein
MKDHWNTLPPGPLRLRIERELAADLPQAIAWQRAAGICWAAGFDVDPPPHTFCDKLIELRQADPKAAGRLMSERSAELSSERVAARLFAGRRAWAKGEPQHVIDAKRTAAKAQVELEAAVETRAQQLVAEQSTKNLEMARKSVRREMKLEENKS